MDVCVIRTRWSYAKMGAKLTDANRLSIRYPDVAAEWHPTENEPLTPHDVSYASNKKVWWLCKRCHEGWDAVVPARTLQKQGCPYCSGRRATDANRLSIHYPGVAAEWHPTKNEPLTPHDVPYASNKKVWWSCKDGHEWESRLSARTRQGQGCPYCSGRRPTDRNRLSIIRPDIAAEWHPARNRDLTPDQVTVSSNETVWWICKKVQDHEWDDTVNHRTSGRGCPFCAGKRISDTNRLSVNYPDVAAEWHPTKNGDLTPDGVTSQSNRKVWWRCEDGHEWEAVIPSRTSQGTGCPSCAGNVVTDANRLSLQCPEVAAEWHPTKNGDAKPEETAVGTPKKAWWSCKQGHEWEASVNSRTPPRSRGCPYCAGQRVTDANRLSLQCPEVAAEWHPTKNGDLTASDVAVGTSKRVWWRCRKGHEWDAVVYSRALPGSRSGCRQCTLRHTSRVEIYLRCELSSVFPDIDPRNTIKIDKWRVDVMIPSEKLVLEYDGGWRHDNQKSYARDMRKTKELKIKGWTVIRIREMPLGRIQSHDLLVDVTFPGDDKIKILTGNVLRHIEKVLGKDIPGVDEYIARPGLAKRELARDIANEIIDESPHPPDQDRLF